MKIKEIAKAILAVAVIGAAGLGDNPKMQPGPESLGDFTITAYCGCPTCCGIWSSDTPMTASGEPAQEGITVAADWDTLPAGTEIEIEGLGEYKVQDKPAQWIVEKYDGRIIDVYFENHEDALKFGKQKMEVYKVE